ncbi:GtrA family protein [Actinoplanes sp. DH11]|uniref:GtrA family protein n=1 Tax=Actinoplanes sp. DH11 TaxID=2857011 RepID=UPI001E3B648E|nr:GtrA family protein [Actinoplanes sp. DH11]
MPRLAPLYRQLFWFMLVGALSTVLQTIVYVTVRGVAPATWASWIALLAITPLNTEAHRRVTFNVRTSAVGRLHWEAGLTSVAVYLANLAVAPWFAGLAGPHPSSLTEALILALTGSLIGALRYVLLRGWVFARHRHQPPPTATGPAAAGGSAPPGRRAGSASAAPVTGNDQPEPRAAVSGCGRRPGFGFRLIRRPGRRCPAVAGSRLRRVRRSPAGRRGSAPDQRPASTR